jgi:flagellar assembly protein FliH
VSRAQFIMDRSSSEVRRWLPPDVGSSSPVSAEPVRPTPSDVEISAIRQAAHAAGAKAGYEAGYLEGYQKGHQEGRDAADQEASEEQRARDAREQEQRARDEQRLQETVAALEGVASDLADPLANLVDALEPELLTLTVTLARRVIMQELSTRPELIQGVLLRALEQLPSRHHAIRVRVHPDECSILTTYAESLGETITWLADPAIEQGGCIVDSGPSRIDATVEARLRQSIDAIWGELARPPEALDLPEAGEAAPPDVIFHGQPEDATAEEKP